MQLAVAVAKTGIGGARFAAVPMFWPATVVDAGVNSSKELWAADASLASFWY
jgi:hypothetical protein